MTPAWDAWLPAHKLGNRAETSHRALKRPVIRGSIGVAAVSKNAEAGCRQGLRILRSPHRTEACDGQLKGERAQVLLGCALFTWLPAGSEKIALGVVALEGL